MKKLLTLVLTVALCLPLFMSYGVEVNAASSASEYLVYLDEYELCVKDYGNKTMWTAYEMSSTLPGRSCTLPGITVDLNAKFNNSPTYTPDPPAVGLTLEFESLDMVAEGGIVEYSYSREQGLSFKFPDDAKAGDEYVVTFTARGVKLICSVPDGGDSVEVELEDVDAAYFIYVDGDTGHASVSGNGIPTSKPEKKKETAEKKAQALEKAIEETVKAEESMPVESFVSTESISALPAEVKETSDAGAVYNLSKITTTQGFIAAVEKMVEANKNTATNTGTNVVTFYSSKPITFNAKSLNALSDTATEFVYMFNHEGHLYKVTIPAGAKIDLEGQMFAGPLYIGAKLGTSVLVK